MSEKLLPTSRRLLVFARAPVPGQCKTRLIPRYGARGAAAIHRQLVQRTLLTASAVNASVELWCAPDSHNEFFATCRRRLQLPLHRQTQDDLGRKMALAMQYSLSRAQSAVIIGTDCPALTAMDIEQAFTALEHGHQFVIKPALDGGYVLIGASVASPSVLRNIDWSSGRELRQTLQNLRRLHFQVSLLAPSWDVDHPADVVRARRAGLL